MYICMYIYTQTHTDKQKANHQATKNHQLQKETKYYVEVSSGKKPYKAENRNRHIKTSLHLLDKNRNYDYHV